jgi:hypothetical protein
MKERGIATTEYQQFVAELKARVLSARISAARAVNRELILLYWDIGRGIVERQERYDWGDGIIKALAKDRNENFRAFPGSPPRTFGGCGSSTWFIRQASFWHNWRRKCVPGGVASRRTVSHKS